jgi:tetratricopeptide (TPR) repeat protein
MRTAKLLTAVSVLSASTLAFAVGLRACGQAPAVQNERFTALETGPLFHFPVEDQKGTAIPTTREAPLSLTASDGTGLTLTALDARAVIEGPLAFTELRLTFENPLDRTLEGTFRVTLPPGAAVSRFAMKLGDKFQEGEVVEKQAARRAYEDFLHRRQDPALLEQAAGNEFSARVFPIPAHGKKELIVSFSQELVGGRPYTLFLRGLPQVGKLDAIIAGTGDDAPILAQLHTENRAPDADLEIDEQRIFAQAKDGVRSGDLALVRIRPAAEAQAEPLGSCVIMVDTSASRALGFAAQTKLLADIVEGLGNTKITVAAFDQGIDVVYEGPAAEFATKGTRALFERGALGASHLEAALSWASLRAQTDGAKRIVLLTDGVATAGETDPTKLRAAATAAKARGVERIDAIAMGGIRDEALLRGLTTAGLPRDGMVIDGTLGAGNAKRRLDGAVRSADVRVEGAEWQWPERLTGLQPSDEGLVFVKIRPDAGPLTVVVSETGGTRPPTRQTPQLTEVKRPLLERAWVGAKINQLVQHPPEGRDKASVDEEIVKLSTTFRVLSPLTALLVLETENDYARYKINRTALADVLAIDGTKLVLNHRQDAELPAKDADFADKSRPEREAEAEPRRRPDRGGEGTPLGTPIGAPGGGGDAKGAKKEKRDAEKKPSARDVFGTARNVDRDEAPMAEAAVAPPAAPPPPPAKALAAPPAMTMAPSPDPAKPAPATGGRAAPAEMAERQRPAPTDGASDDKRKVADRPTAAAGPRPPQTVVGNIARPPIGEPAPMVRPRPILPEDRRAPPPRPKSFGPYQGPLAEVMELLAASRTKDALARALAYHRESPGEVLALVALGECFEALGEIRSAARAYGSLIDLFPDRADLRRMAGERLEHLQVKEARYAHALAADSYAKAVEQRPDHPSSHRLLAFARLRAGDYEGAFAAMEASLDRTYPSGRFAGVDRILREDLGLVGAAWERHEPGRAGEIDKRLANRRAILPSVPSLRFVLVWETDNNDVDFHIYDNANNHAYYGQKTLATGGSLFADVTTGFGPECFSIEQGDGKFATPYRLEANYFSRGPMGYGMGKLEIIEHDGKGNLTFDERPYVIMVDHASVPLGTFPADSKKPVNILDGASDRGSRPELPHP